MKIFDKIKDYFAYYHEEDELPIDFCPICEEKLPDNKRKTRMEHNKLKHFDPKARKKKIKRIAFAFAVPLVYLVIILGLAYWLTSNTDLNSWCIDEIESLNTIIRSENRYPIEQQQEIEQLIENCKLRFSIGSNTNYNPDQ